MKSYEEMARCVIETHDKQIEKRRKNRNTFLLISAASASFLLCFAVTKATNPKNTGKPEINNITSVITTSENIHHETEISETYTDTYSTTIYVTSPFTSFSEKNSDSGYSYTTLNDSNVSTNENNSEIYVTEYSDTNTNDYTKQTEIFITENSTTEIITAENSITETESFTTESQTETVTTIPESTTYTESDTSYTDYTDDTDLPVPEATIRPWVPKEYPFARVDDIIFSHSITLNIDRTQLEKPVLAGVSDLKDGNYNEIKISYILKDFSKDEVIVIDANQYGSYLVYINCSLSEDEMKVIIERLNVISNQ